MPLATRLHLCFDALLFSLLTLSTAVTLDEWVGPLSLPPPLVNFFLPLPSLSLASLPSFLPSPGRARPLYTEWGPALCGELGMHVCLGGRGKGRKAAPAVSG